MQLNAYLEMMAKHLFIMLSRPGNAQMTLELILYLTFFIRVQMGIIYTGYCMLRNNINHKSSKMCGR